MARGRATGAEVFVSDESGQVGALLPIASRICGVDSSVLPAGPERFADERRTYRVRMLRRGATLRCARFCDLHDVVMNNVMRMVS
jgi:hypothetical protein